MWVGGWAEAGQGPKRPPPPRPWGVLQQWPDLYVGHTPPCESSALVKATAGVVAATFGGGVPGSCAPHARPNFCCDP